MTKLVCKVCIKRLFIWSSLIPAGIQLPDLCHLFDSCSIWNYGGLREWVLGCRNNSVLILKLLSLSSFDTIRVNLFEAQAQIKAQETPLLLFIFSELALNFSGWPTKTLRVVTKITDSQVLCQLQEGKFFVMKKSFEYEWCYGPAEFSSCGHWKQLSFRHSSCSK